MTAVFIEPCDIVFFRDDLPFGDRGNQFGRCQFPPRPSVIAGALRTQILVNRGIDFDAFRRGVDVPETVQAELGRVDGTTRSDFALVPGTFRLTGLSLGRRGNGRDVLYYRPGRDLVAAGKKGEGAADEPRLLAPALGERLPGVSSLAGLSPVAAVPGFEPARGWLAGDDYARYLAGAAPRDLVREEAPREAAAAFPGVASPREAVLDWDDRVGIGLDAETRTVDEGRLYSSRGAVMRQGWGFVATVEGSTLVSASGLVRLGGDSRMARLSPWSGAEPDWSQARRAVAGSGRFRVVLQSPAIFAGGWCPGAVRHDSGRLVYEREGFRARLVSAAVGAPELAGGWDLVRQAPKPFRRMVPAGSVFWFEVLSGSGEDAWRLFHGQSVSDEKSNEGFGIAHVGGWPDV
jgi:CRISPR-associated protein Cmr3